MPEDWQKAAARFFDSLPETRWATAWRNRAIRPSDPNPMLRIHLFRRRRLHRS